MASRGRLAYATVFPPGSRWPYATPFYTGLVPRLDGMGDLEGDVRRLGGRLDKRRRQRIQASSNLDRANATRNRGKIRKAAARLRKANHAYAQALRAYEAKKARLEAEQRQAAAEAEAAQREQVPEPSSEAPAEGPAEAPAEDATEEAMSLLLETD